MKFCSPPATRIGSFAKSVTAGSAAALLCCSFVGCAPSRFVEGVQYAADRSGVRNAGSLRVARHGYLRFDHAALSDLDDVLLLEDLGAIHADGVRVLEAGQSEAVRVVDAEIDRLPPDALDDVVDRYHHALAPKGSDARREFLKAQFAAQSEELLAKDVERLSATSDVKTARRFLRRIRSAVEPPSGDRGKVTRALLGAPLFLPAAIGAEIADAEASQRVVTMDFARVALYQPSERKDPPDAAALEAATPDELAAWYAPVFVQQVDPNSTYTPEDDRFGRVYLTGAASDIRVHVDCAQPVVYWTHQWAKVWRRRYDQLVYVTWYPRRPEMSDNDPSAGNIDGVVVRITLDRHRRPAIYEFVRSCGCYHTLWVAEFIEAAARAEFGTPTGDRRYAVQRANVNRELFIPELVRDDGSHPHRPVAFVAAGYHLLMGIHPLQDEPAPGKVEAEYVYTLEPYDDLTRLPLGDGVASMFGSDGLVHNAGRVEGWLLAPTGMLSAGQPRQLGTMKIRMDAYDYDDPRLLERNLRLPSGF
jgi:hypothetical protein